MITLFASTVMSCLLLKLAFFVGFEGKYVGYWRFAEEEGRQHFFRFTCLQGSFIVANPFLYLILKGSTVIKKIILETK